MKRINLNRPAIVLPAILYVPLVLLGYLIIDLFYTGTDIARIERQQDTHCIDTAICNRIDRVLDDMKFKGKNIMTFFSDFANKGALRIVVVTPEEKEFKKLPDKEPVPPITKSIDTTDIKLPNSDIEKHRLAAHIKSVMENSRSKTEDDFVVYAVMLTVFYVIYMVAVIGYCFDENRRKRRSFNNISLMNIFGTEGMIPVKEYVEDNDLHNEIICDEEQGVMSQGKIIDDEIETVTPVETPEFPDKEYESEMYRTVMEEPPLTQKQYRRVKRGHDIHDHHLFNDNLS